MSSDAIGWAFRHSPYKGAALAVHLAIADSVNDQNDNELWMSVVKLALKARVERRTAGRALAEMTDAGLLVLLEDHSAERKPNRYRFLFPDVPVVFETRHGSREPMTRVEGTHAHGSPGPTNPIRTQENPNSRAVTDLGFERFYSIYPRRKAKVAALKAYERAVTREKKTGLTDAAAADKIFTRARRFATLVQEAGTEQRYVALPTTWLNEGRYDDEELLPQNFNSRLLHPKRVAPSNDGITYT